MVSAAPRAAREAHPLHVTSAWAEWYRSKPSLHSVMLLGGYRGSQAVGGDATQIYASVGLPKTLGRFPCQIATSVLPHKLTCLQERCRQTKLSLMSLFPSIFWKSILPLQQHLLLLMSNVFMQFSLRWGLKGHKNKENFDLGNLCVSGALG